MSSNNEQTSSEEQDTSSSATTKSAIPEKTTISSNSESKESQSSNSKSSNSDGHKSFLEEEKEHKAVESDAADSVNGDNGSQTSDENDEIHAVSCLEDQISQEKDHFNKTVAQSSFAEEAVNDELEQATKYAKSRIDVELESMGVKVSDTKSNPNPDLIECEKDPVDQDDKKFKYRKHKLKPLNPIFQSLVIPDEILDTPLVTADGSSKL